MRNASGGSLMPAMTSTTTVSHAQDPGLEARVHKLKLQWMIATDDNERRKISEEIRRLLGSPGK